MFSAVSTGSEWSIKGLGKVNDVDEQDEGSADNVDYLLPAYARSNRFDTPRPALPIAYKWLGIP